MMKFDWKEWLQILSNLALLVGIGLVIFEMQQNQTLVRAQLASDGISDRMELATSLIGETPNEVLAKACFSPGELTEEDKLELRRIMRAHILIAIRSRILEGIGNFGGDYESTFRSTYRQLSTIEYFRELYAENPQMIGLNNLNGAEEEMRANRRESCDTAIMGVI